MSPEGYGGLGRSMVTRVSRLRSNTKSKTGKSARMVKVGEGWV